MKPDFSRQRALADLSVPRVATTIGTGAVGCWVAYFAALGGTERLLIYTIGSVKPTDVARFPFSSDMIGKPYAFALSKVILTVRPDIDLIIHGKFRAEIDDLEGTVFNCAASELKDFDVELAGKCKAKGLRYFTGCYSGHTTIVSDHVVDRFAHPSLEAIPTWCGSAALTALYTVYLSSLNLTGPIFRSTNVISGTSCEAADLVVLEGGSGAGR